MGARRRLLGVGVALALASSTASASDGLRVTTALGGVASQERMEGRLESRTTLVSPQVGCWWSVTRGFFLGLELGWAVASSEPRVDGGRRDGGFAGLARPTASVLHLGWR